MMARMVVRSALLFVLFSACSATIRLVQCVVYHVLNPKCLNSVPLYKRDKLSRVGRDGRVTALELREHEANVSLTNYYDVSTVQTK